MTGDRDRLNVMLRAVPNLPAGPARTSLLRKTARLSNRIRLQQRIRSCETCGLSSGTTPVPWSGPDRPVEIVVVGEAPGRTEEQAGEPFVGAAGRLLRRALTQAGIEPSEVAFVNTICCRPAGNDWNRAVEADAANLCRPLFDAQLKHAGGWLVVLAGKVAYQNVTDDHTSTLRTVRGCPFWKSGGPGQTSGRMLGRLHVATWHPAYVLRNQKALPELVADLRTVRELRDGDRRIPGLELADFGFDRAAVSESQQRGLSTRVRTQGWAVWYSNVLGDSIVVTTDGATPEIPDQFAQLACYELGELVKIGVLGAEGRMNMGDLEAVHMVKKQLGGRVVR